MRPVLSEAGQAPRVRREATAWTPRTWYDGTVAISMPPASPSANVQAQSASSEPELTAGTPRPDVGLTAPGLERAGYCASAVDCQEYGVSLSAAPTFAKRTYKWRGHSILNHFKDLFLIPRISWLNDCVRYEAPIHVEWFYHELLQGHSQGQGFRQPNVCADKFRLQHIAFRPILRAPQLMNTRIFMGFRPWLCRHFPVRPFAV